MNIVQPLNTKVLSFLLSVARGARRGTPVLEMAKPNVSIWRPQDKWGCDEDVVNRLWREIGATLPEDCRALVHQDPALVPPKSGVILAIGINRDYGLRLPGKLAAEAIKSGAKTYTKWTSGGGMDIQHDLGEDWVFGGWSPNELVWCRKAYEFFDHEV